MDDRELLELAAKAAERPIHDWNGSWPVEYVEHWSGNPNEPPEQEVVYWNPLADDGDALRLAVTCKIALNPMLVDGLNRDLHESAAGGVNRWTDCREKHNGDPFAATRRSIVRAAAEIGRAM